MTSSKCRTIVFCRTEGFSGAVVTPVTWLAHQDLWYPPFLFDIDGKRKHGAPGEQNHAQQDTEVRRMAVSNRAFAV